MRAWGNLYLDELEKAAEDLEEALRREPNFTPGHALLGRVKLEQYTRGLYGDPQTHEERVQELAPLLEEARQALEKGWTRGAEGVSIEKWGLRKTREDDVAQTLAGALAAMYIEKDRSKGVQILTEAYRIEKSEEYCNWLGIYAETLEERIEWRTRAIEIMPHYARAYLDRGSERRDKGDLEGSIEDYGRAIDINPRLAEAYLNRALAREALATKEPVWAREHLRSAVSDLEKALDLAPQSWPHRNLAESSLQRIRDSLGKLDR